MKDFELELNGWILIDRQHGFPSVSSFLEDREDMGKSTRGLLLIVNDPQGELHGGNVLLVGDVNGEGGWCDCCTGNYYVRAYKQLDDIPTKIEQEK